MIVPEEYLWRKYGNLMTEISMKKVVLQMILHLKGYLSDEKHQGIFYTDFYL